MCRIILLHRINTCLEDDSLTILSTMLKRPKKHISKKPSKCLILPAPVRQNNTSKFQHGESKLDRLLASSHACIALIIACDCG